MPNQQALITATSVSRIYHTTEKIYAVRDVSLTIMSGAVTILRGRSGSGKTTLINLLGALDRPTEGEILFDSIQITKLSDSERDQFRRKNIGFIFQSVALIPTMNAVENVEFSLRIAGIKKNLSAIAKDSLAQVGLANRLKHRTHELSGGEQQRVAIARAMAHSPKVILADEPTAELDSHMGHQVMELFNTIAKQGITVLMTTHDPELFTAASKVYTMKDGVLI